MMVHVFWKLPNLHGLTAAKSRTKIMSENIILLSKAVVLLLLVLSVFVDPNVCSLGFYI